MKAAGKPRTAAELLRDFVSFQGSGIRGVLRMYELKEEASRRLRLIDRQRQNKSARRIT